MPTSRCPIERVNAHAAANPIAIPATTSSTPCLQTSRRISRRCAPRAARMPISRVRCAAAYETTPYTPTIPRARPINPSAVANPAAKRNAKKPKAPSSDCCIVSMSIAETPVVRFEICAFTDAMSDSGETTARICRTHFEEKFCARGT